MLHQLRVQWLMLSSDIASSTACLLMLWLYLLAWNLPPHLPFGTTSSCPPSISPCRGHFVPSSGAWMLWVANDVLWYCNTLCWTFVPPYKVT